MKNKFLLSLMPVLITAIYSCNDFVEPNISNKEINILAPENGYKTSNTAMLFWWDELKGAQKYSLQIVSPSFSSIQRLILDTNVTKNKYTFALQPGKYQWRIKAINNGGCTDYVTRTLTVDSTIDLSTQTIVFIFPVDNYFTRSLTNTFSWNKLYNATSYQVQFENKKTAGIILDTILADNSLSLSLTEGAYTWRVRAKNAQSNSPYSSHSITIDLTAPNVPILTSPINGDAISNPVTLTWTNDPSATGDSLYIYGDSLVSPPLQRLYETSTTYNYTGTIGQTYFWRLRSGDAGGNWSAYSPVKKFRVK